MVGLVTGLVVEIVPLAEQADAKGCAIGSIGYNGSQGRCFKG